MSLNFIDIKDALSQQISWDDINKVSSVYAIKSAVITTIWNSIKEIARMDAESIASQSNIVGAINECFKCPKCKTECLDKEHLEQHKTDCEALKNVIAAKSGWIYAVTAGNNLAAIKCGFSKTNDIEHYIFKQYSRVFQPLNI